MDKESETDWGEMIMYAVTIVVLGGRLCGGVATYVNHRLNLEDDHPVEEIAESIIEQKTGVDIDLSPESPEQP